MKKILFTMVIVLTASPCFAEQITLICKGWHPFYQSFDEKPVNPPSDNESFTIKLDTVKRVASYDTPLGEIQTNLKEKADFYYGGIPMNNQVGRHRISSLDISMNRLDGGTHISYVLNGNDKEKRVLFTGTCAPGKQLF